MPNRKRVVVTGMGVVAPNAIGMDNFWKAIVSGKSGIGKITRFDTKDFPSKIAGEINGFDVGDAVSRKHLRQQDRFTQLAFVAGKEAIKDAKLDITPELQGSLGIVLGSALGGIPFAEEQHNVFIKEGLRRVNPYLAIRLFHGGCASQLSILLGIKAFGNTVSNACSSGADAIGEALLAIRKGKAKVVIAGGAEAPLAPLTFGAFCLIKVVSKRNNEPEKASRPFDKDRDGFVMAEGAGILILEELEHALQRGAKIYAEIAGYGTTLDGYHMTRPEPSGEQKIEAVKDALKDANVSENDIDYINAHGTATVLNDKNETMVVKKVFGKRAYEIPMSSTKSMIGHTFGAGGAIETMAAILAMEHGTLPPTINCDNPGPECDLDYVPNKSREKKVNVALKNSFGFGGKNTTLVIKKFRD